MLFNDNSSAYHPIRAFAHPSVRTFICAGWDGYTIGGGVTESRTFLFSDNIRNCQTKKKTPLYLSAYIAGDGILRSARSDGAIFLGIPSPSPLRLRRICQERKVVHLPIRCEGSRGSVEASPPALPARLSRFRLHAGALDRTRS